MTVTSEIGCCAVFEEKQYAGTRKNFSVIAKLLWAEKNKFLECIFML
jgi:hypothetical protein